MPKLQPPPIQEIAQTYPRLAGWLRDVWKRAFSQTIGKDENRITILDSDGNLTDSDPLVDEILTEDEVLGTDDQIKVTVNSDHTITLSVLNLLLAISAMTADDSNFIVGDGTTFVEESGSTARDSLELGTLDTVEFLNLIISYMLTSAQAGIGDVSGGDYTEIESDGTVVFHGDATVWEDLQVSISNIRVPASSAPTERLYDGGTGGVSFPFLGFDVSDYIYFDVQTSHSMKLNAVLDNHIHFSLPNTTDIGDKFQFQLDVMAAGINTEWEEPTGTPFTSEHTIVANDDTYHRLLEIAEIPSSNDTVSTIYKCKLTRIAASSDEYASEVYVTFSDCHYEKDTIGSRLEDSK